MPKPGSGRVFKAIRHIKFLCLSLYGFGESIEDVREIKEDGPLREALRLIRTPSFSAIGDWLKRAGTRGGIKGWKGCQVETFLAMHFTLP